MRLDAVIFDLDGVIVSTDEFHYQAWQQLADAEGIPFSRETNHRLRGVSRMASLEIILERAGRVYTAAEKVALADRKNEAYRALLTQLSPRDILPGVMALLGQLRARGIRTAIASSSRNAGTILERIGLKRTFDAVVDGNDITHSKPHPEVFLTAARLLGVPPACCLVIEDAAAGVAAAHTGGMRCLAVGAAAGHQQADLSAPDLCGIDTDRLLSV
jgi:beta-phosphoglucomutase